MGMQGDTYAAHQDLGPCHRLYSSYSLLDVIFHFQVVRAVAYVVSVQCHSSSVILAMPVIMHPEMTIRTGYQQMNRCRPVWLHLNLVKSPII